MGGRRVGRLVFRFRILTILLILYCFSLDVGSGFGVTSTGQSQLQDNRLSQLKTDLKAKWRLVQGLHLYRAS